MLLICCCASSGLPWSVLTLLTRRVLRPSRLCHLAEVDQCMMGLHNCDSEATCMDTTHGFTCQCWSGLAGNGTIGNCAGT